VRCVGNMDVFRGRRSEERERRGGGDIGGGETYGVLGVTAQFLLILTLAILPSFFQLIVFGGFDFVFGFVSSCDWGGRMLAFDLSFAAVDTFVELDLDESDREEEEEKIEGEEKGSRKEGRERLWNRNRVGNEKQRNPLLPRSPSFNAQLEAVVVNERVVAIELERKRGAVVRGSARRRSGVDIDKDIDIASRATS
jgi:hypothetical protein